MPPRLKAGTPSQFPAGRSPAACPPSSAMAPRDFRKPPNPGRATAAISSPAAPAVPRNSFSRRPSRRMRATTSPAGSAAPRPARRNSSFSSRAQAGEFSPPPRSGLPGNRRSPYSITGKRPAPLTPPAADVPGYQHVFLFYFENEDYSQVIGNAKQAPYLNSLRRGGATLTNFYAEEHPSDANYLALAGGSAFRGQRRIVEGLPAERERPVRRHRARLFLERRPADDVLPGRP